MTHARGPRVEWDSRTGAANREKHGVSFEEADSRGDDVVLENDARIRMGLVTDDEYLDRESTLRDFHHAIRGSDRARIERGDIRSGRDIHHIRRWSRIRLCDFASALGMTTADLRRAERDPHPPSHAVRNLLRIAAHDPRALRRLVPDAS